jgi:hypothetical protein
MIIMPRADVPHFFPDETFEIRNEVIEGEEVRHLAVDNIVFFAVDVLQKEPFVDGYEVGPVAQFNYEIKQREGQGIADLLAPFRERPLMRDKLVRVQFKPIRHRTIEEIVDDVLNSVRCIAPALVADSDAAEHEYRLFYILEIDPAVSLTSRPARREPLPPCNGQRHYRAKQAEGRRDGRQSARLRTSGHPFGEALRPPRFKTFQA